MRTKYEIENFNQRAKGYGRLGMLRTCNNTVKVLPGKGDHKGCVRCTAQYLLSTRGLVGGGGVGGGVGRMMHCNSYSDG